MRISTLALAALGAASPFANADVVSDWNKLACAAVAEAKLGPGLGNRALAITHTAVYEAVNAITKKYPSSRPGIRAEAGASVEAAVAAANHAALTGLLPSKAAAIDAAYRDALAAIPDGPAEGAGVAVGEAAAAALLAERMDDGATGPDTYRPVTAPGVYVPTATTAIVQWAVRKPWNLASPSQFRPGPPPALTSELWARDFNEIKALGGKTGSSRTAAQTEMASFWEATLPSIYHGVVRSVADQPGREITRNARLFAAVTQGMDDALISVFDAKYHYNFWRPVTAIRNADQDGNDATERDPSWTPFIETPMHPEYPCAHCILSATVGTVIQADSGKDKLPKLATTSYLVKDSERSWVTVDEFMQEVSEARIYDGVHYRTSTEVGMAMGKQVGALVADKLFAAP